MLRCRFFTLISNNIRSTISQLSSIGNSGRRLKNITGDKPINLQLSDLPSFPSFILLNKRDTLNLSGNVHCSLIGYETERIDECLHKFHLSSRHIWQIGKRLTSNIVMIHSAALGINVCLYDSKCSTNYVTKLIYPSIQHLNIRNGRNHFNNYLDHLAFCSINQSDAIEAIERLTNMEDGGTTIINEKIIYNKHDEKEMRLISFIPKSSNSSLKYVVTIPFNKFNQIGRFIHLNNGNGLQHIALYSSAIIEQIKELRKDNQIKFRKIPSAYYENLSELNKENEFISSNVSDFQHNNILIDSNDNHHLMQIFTESIGQGNDDSLFLEFIQRSKTAKGFGEANIRALWDSIEYSKLKMSGK
ncbi:hypothetical protein SNEBB_009699 [Seison nebaliae]|nr:hypothetical protein SNEBB_009699 [Seison nebaliae]